VRVRVAARPDVRFDGVVAAIAPLAEDVAGQPSYTVRATLPNPDGILRPGMTARARILTGPVPLIQMLVRRPWQFVRLHLWW
jgi:multidrug efflux pump subunit AcrA (membrane-fusion protein)